MTCLGPKRAHSASDTITSANMKADFWVSANLNPNRENYFNPTLIEPLSKMEAFLPLLPPTNVNYI